MRVIFMPFSARRKRSGNNKLNGSGAKANKLGRKDTR